MIFIKTILFTKYLPKYLEDDEYRELQNFLIGQPEAGKLIPGTGGLRKLKWNLSNSGKRGGLRVIYYFHIPGDHIYFFTLYAKNEMSDLSAKEKKALKLLLEGWYNG
jgi:hypothetical protein